MFPPLCSCDRMAPVPCEAPTEIHCPFCERDWCRGCFRDRRHHTCEEPLGVTLERVVYGRIQEEVPA